ncbi:hypothetical protein MP228_001446 [Amoeboaphelidium protococcarum]|nr:hypothetical protein MP228_001446 [Amoeboaphelidium protococcarum]
MSNPAKLLEQYLTVVVPDDLTTSDQLLAEIIQCISTPDDVDDLLLNCQSALCAASTSDLQSSVMRIQSRVLLVLQRLCQTKYQLCTFKQSLFIVQDIVCFILTSQKEQSDNQVSDAIASIIQIILGVHARQNYAQWKQLVQILTQKELLPYTQNFDIKSACSSNSGNANDSNDDRLMRNLDFLDLQIQLTRSKQDYQSLLCGKEAEWNVKEPQAQLYHEWKQFKDDIAQLQQQLARETKDLELVKEKHIKYVNDINAKMKKLRSDYSTQSDECKQLVRQRDEALEEVVRLKDQNQQLDSQLTVSRKEVEILKSQAEQRQADNMQFRELQSQQEEFKACEYRLMKITEERDQLLKAVHCLESDNKEFQKKQATQNDDIEHLRAEISRLQRQLSSSDQKFAELVNARRQDALKMAELRKQNEELSQRITSQNLLQQQNG